MSNSSFYIVGIGASAGGYEALTKFFTSMPESSNVAFVLVQHLSPDFKSLTKEWLSKQTKIKVINIEEGTEVVPGHIYIMPENKTLKIKGTKLILAEREKDEVINLAIDIFFHSLGQELKEKAIGVILSGTGTDGSRGIRTIKQYGGAVFVQQPDSADFDGMPNVAIATDHPDFIQPPEKLGESLMKYIKNPVNFSEDSFTPSDLTEKEILQEIIAHVSNYSSVNFRGYKINTIIRRIEKRMKLNHFTNISEYHHFTKHNPEEIHALYNYLLIGVTHFFRDPEAFEAMDEKVIPALFKNRKSFETVRIWAVGCSTGEEAYSIAILCDEYVKKHQLDIPFKIFATDLDPRAIEVACIGRYRKNIVTDVTPERLEAYFDKIEEFYGVKKDLRKKIIFARHNLLSDPPFIKLDLIVCRNLFIYLKSDFQTKLLDSFNFALKPNAFLFLGANETSNGINQSFDQINAKWKIFRNKPEGKRKPYIPGRESTELISDGSNRFLLKNDRTKARSKKDEEDYEATLINKYAPVCIFVNGEDEVTYSHGNIKKYLMFPEKRMSINIYDMISGRSPTIFRNGLRKARNGETILFKDVPFENDEHNFTVNINFNASEDKDKVAKPVLIEFLEPSPASVKKTVVDGLSKDTFSYKEVEELEKELKLTKKELQFAVDELETMNEELQASNEEMHSSNEELQSTNEEMQSSNEELHTVNTELQIRLDEISSLHNDINNLINNSEIAIVFLDEDLRIRIFTPAAKSNFNFLESDIGRPFSHLTHNFVYRKFSDDIREVLHSHEAMEKEVEDNNGKFYIVRIYPYKAGDNKMEGIVFTFVDVTQLKKVTRDLQTRTEELEISGQNWKSLVNNTPDLIARYDEHLKYISINEAMAKHLGLPISGIIGKSNIDLPLPNQAKEIKKWLACVEETLNTGKSSNTFFNYLNGSSEKHFYSSFVPEFFSDDQKVQSVLSISRDITPIINHEKLIEKQNIQLNKINNDMDNFIYTASHDLKSPIANIEGLTSILRKKLGNKLEESTSKILDMMDKSVSKFITTIGDLTEITKTQRDVASETEDLGFKDLIEDVKEDIQQLISESGATIKEDLKVKNIIYSKPNLTHIAGKSLKSIFFNFFSTL